MNATSVEENKMSNEDLMKVKVEKEPDFEMTEVPDNVYEAKIVDVKVDEMEWDNIPRLRCSLTFEINEGMYTGKRLMGFATAKINPRTKLWKWMGAMDIHPEVGDEYHLSLLKGKKARILTETVSRQRNDGSTYKVSNVKDILRREKYQAAPYTATA